MHSYYNYPIYSRSLTQNYQYTHSQTMNHDLQIACWFDAIRNNHCDVITTLHRLFDLDINDNTSYEEYFARPIHIAADTDNEDTIRLIVSLGGEVNTTDYYGVTPLYRAALNNATTSIKVLLELGADLYANVHCGFTPDYSDKYITPLDMMKEKNNGKLHDFVVPYTKEYKRLRKLQIYARVVGKMMKQYQRSVENVWKPDGVGYHIARMDFEQYLISI